MIFQIGIGIAIAISISDGDRDRDRDLDFGDRGHALPKHYQVFSTHFEVKGPQVIGSCSHESNDD